MSGSTGQISNIMNLQSASSKGCAILMYFLNFKETNTIGLDLWVFQMDTMMDGR